VGQHAPFLLECGVQGKSNCQMKTCNIPYLLNYPLSCTTFIYHISVTFSPLSLHVTIHDVLKLVYENEMCRIPKQISACYVILVVSFQPC